MTIRKNILFYWTPLLMYCTLLQAEELKIGYINVEQILEKAPQAERAKKELESEFSPRNKRIIAATKELKNLEQKHSRDSAVMSDPERRKMEKDIINKKRDIKRSQEEFSEDFNIRRNEELGKLQRQIVEAIQAFAKEENFDLVLTHGVIYAGDKVNVTEKVQRKLK